MVAVRSGSSVLVAGLVLSLIPALAAGAAADEGDAAVRAKQVTRLEFPAGAGGTGTNPEYPFRGKTFEVRRVLKAEGGEVLPGRTVALYWAPRPNRTSPYPTTGWKWLTSGMTGRDGRVVLRATAWNHGWLKTVFAGDVSYQRVESGYEFRSYYQTAITRFNASPEPARAGRYLTITGRLWRWTASGGWRPVKGKRISADYRLKGTKQWRSAWCYNGGASTDSRGWFRLGCLTRKDASWRTYYLNNYQSPVFNVNGPQQLDFPALSASDYVDVR